MATQVEMKKNPWKPGERKFAFSFSFSEIEKMMMTQGDLSLGLCLLHESHGSRG
jgi:hypothetical protein